MYSHQLVARRASVASDLENDLRYRVCRVILWGAKGFDGYRFVFRHYRTGQEVNGKSVATHRAQRGAVPPVVYPLEQGEYIVGVEGEESTYTDALELVTSTGRRLRVGHGGGSAFRRGVDSNHEVRGLNCLFSSLGEIEQVQPRAVKIPTMNMLRDADHRVLRAYQESKALERECYRLQTDLNARFNEIVSILQRGIAYPTALAVEYIDIADAAVHVLHACKNRLGFAFGGKHRVSEQMNDVTKRITHLDELIKEFTSAEAILVNQPEATPTIDQVRGLILEAMDKKDVDVVIKLYVQHLDMLRESELRRMLMEKLIRESDRDHLETLIRSLATTTQRTVPQVLADLTSQVPTPFQMAVRFENLPFVEWLLMEGHVDPFEELPPNEASDWTAKMPEELLESVEDSEIQMRMRYLFTHIKKRREFASQTALMATTGEITFDQLILLVPHVTSVYDMQPLYTFGVTHLDADQFKTLVVCASDHIIQEKLVLDDNAAVFFKMALKHLLSKEVITRIEYEQYKIRNVKVNMEGAEWVIEIKQSIQKLQWQVETIEDHVNVLQRSLSNLRNALIQKEVAEAQRRRCEHMVSLISMALFAIGGPVFQALQDAINLAEPLHLFFAALSIDEEQVGQFLSDKCAQFVFREGVQDVLEQAHLDPEDFVGVLRDAVILEHPELVKQNPQDGTEDTPPAAISGFIKLENEIAVVHEPPVVDVSKEMTRLSFSEPVIKSQGSFERNEQHLAQESMVFLDPPKGAWYVTPPSSNESFLERRASMDSVSSFRMSTAPPSVHVDESELEAHPYHFAVYESGGDLKEFSDIVQWFDQEDRSKINDELSVTVEPDNTQKMMQPQVYASYLGYLEIVEHLFHNPELAPREKRYLTMRRAQQRQTQRASMASSA
ncbi:hypothetical protein Poli38472_000913 [Pythium oligandrum]|uniref:Uncharacterized protein n=1 Tax=Pythium oligandrum TaxID=41045 RepID=A0A8K1FFS5_PYTOL|nr:hypothetical protein Poli38472_000913 [Pythium oligandrum]|eukprot:TMW60871.1 hypothetical protein Poli38472_000913 [Pythium oligandrum]